MADPISSSQKFEFERARKIFNEISKGTIQDNKDVVTSLTNTDLAKDEMKRLRERIRKIQKEIVDKFLASQKKAYELKQKAQEIVESTKSEIIKSLIS